MTQGTERTVFTVQRMMDGQIETFNRKMRNVSDVVPDDLERYARTAFQERRRPDQQHPLLLERPCAVAALVVQRLHR